MGMTNRKLNYSEQIKHLSEKGVKFEIMNKSDATNFIKNNTYFFKIKSYAKNYDYVDGQYINLDFAYLVELSKLDMYLRRVILKCCLDIEHHIKNRIMKNATNLDQVDGFDVVKNFISTYKGEGVIERLKKLTDSSSIYDLFKHYENNLSIWSFLEMLTFSELIEFSIFYYNELGISNNSDSLLWSLKFLRNSSAHNNCMLNTLKRPFSKRYEVNRYLRSKINPIGFYSKNQIDKFLKNPIIHDLVCSFLAVKEFLPENSRIRSNSIIEFGRFLRNECYRNKEYFINCIHISESILFLNKSFDFFLGDEYNSYIEQNQG